MADNKKLVALLKQALTLLQGEGESEAVAMPEPAAVAKLAVAKLKKLGEQFGIDTENMKDSKVKAVMNTAACVVHDELDDLDSDDLKTLCLAVGVQPTKKDAATVTALKEYFDTAGDTEDGEEAEEEEAEEETEDEEEETEDEEEASDDEDSSDDDDDDEEEKPKKKKKVADDEDESDEEGEDDDDESGDDDESESSDDDDESEGDEDESELTEKQVKLFNKVAKKKVKNVKELTKLLTDDEGNVAEWGTPYVKDETAFCCGLPLKDVKKGKKECGQCQITKKLYEQDDDGNLVEVE
jgi:hypothetical protein